MAIKGPSYTKTTWNFEERPVASSKLNTWDDRIEAALELLAFLLNHAWGGGAGVVRGATTDDLATVAKSPPAMLVQVKPGYAFIKKNVYKLATATDTPELVAPTTNPRIDLVQANLESWNITIKTGTEATTPAAPPSDTDCIALAHIYLRPGMSSIKNIDDTINGYITDARAFL